VWTLQPTKDLFVAMDFCDQVDEAMLIMEAALGCGRRRDVDASVIVSCSEDKSSQGSGPDESETLECIPKDLHFSDQLEQAMLSMGADCGRRRGWMLTPV